MAGLPMGGAGRNGMVGVVLDNKAAIESILNSWAGNLLPESLKSSVEGAAKDYMNIVRRQGYQGLYYGKSAKYCPWFCQEDD